MKEPNPDLNTLRTIFILQDLQDAELAEVGGLPSLGNFPRVR